MKRIYKQALSLFLVAIFCATLFSCVDLIDDYDSEIPQGECNVTFDLQGMPMQPALTRTNGNAIRNIRNLYILFYTPGASNADNYTLAYAFTTDPLCANDVFTKGPNIASKNDEERVPDAVFDPNDGQWGGSAESTTQSATVSNVIVPRGRYAVYVVANVDAFSSDTLSRQTVATVGALRNYNLSWNQDNISANDAMFGFFTESSTNGYDAINQTAPIISLAANATTLHAWVKRAVSKVTVAFDGSQLRENVRIYIKDVTIRDIPANCKLGANNSPSSLSELLANGEQIVYEAAEGSTNATRISSHEPYFPHFTGLAENPDDVEKWKNDVHSETAQALYFFENRQGKSGNAGSATSDPDGDWKQQTDENNNQIPDDRDSDIHPDIDTDQGILKDTKTFGTYIEVKAYYQNDNFGAQTEGVIRYRFMLGKNTTNDFNADRNNHYKLTMRFKNNANDVDWHIDYSDQPGVYIPDTIYVSYSYNTPTLLPIRVVGQEVSRLSVTLNSSNWYPDDSTIPHYTGTTTPTGLATGFLSLTYDENPRIKTNESWSSDDVARVSSYWLNQPNNTTRNYINNGQKVTWNDLDAHNYDVKRRTSSEGYTVYEANIPLFTRPLIIYKWTSWTGANPYFSSERTARITLNGIIDGTPFSKDITVKQVRRIENPTGIYRRHDSTDPFDVTLMERNGEGGSHTMPISYVPFRSHGAWKATIYRSTSGSGREMAAWFTLTAGSQTVHTTGEFIQGDPNSLISFTYKPNGTIGQNQVRCGIIKIEYNDYTCTHYIFVRQGYAPMQLEADKVYWHTFNLYSGAQETSHPCEAGSLFLRGLWSPAILDSNPAGFGEAVSTLTAITDDTGSTTANVPLPMSNTGSYARKDFPAAAITLTKNDTRYNPWNSGRVPTLTEWSTLQNEVANATIDKAFGVLYADGITRTQTTPDNAYTCRHADVNDGKSLKGMRGCFVYNTTDGRNLFFPIGAEGYGRRKTGDSGQLQYSRGDSYNANLISDGRRPLLYSLYSNEGAIYWGQALEKSNLSSSGNSFDNAWDINYKTYDFDYMGGGDNVTAACFLRLVQDTAP